MGLFRSKQETYAEATIAADIERGLVARYLARILERGDLPLRGLLGVLRWVNERRDLMSFAVPDELSPSWSITERIARLPLNHQWRSSVRAIS